MVKLTPKQIANFQNFFETEKTRILQGHNTTDEKFHVDSNEKSDEIDVASTESSQEMVLRLRNREVLYLKKVDEALHRIREGQYGICEGCDGEVGLKRLQARPTATLCISCKEEQERAENRTIGGQRSKSVGQSFFPKS